MREINPKTSNRGAGSIRGAGGNKSLSILNNLLQVISISNPFLNPCHYNPITVLWNFDLLLGMHLEWKNREKLYFSLKPSSYSIRIRTGIRSGIPRCDI